MLWFQSESELNDFAFRGCSHVVAKSSINGAHSLGNASAKLESTSPKVFLTKSSCSLGALRGPPLATMLCFTRSASFLVVRVLVAS